MLLQLFKIWKESASKSPISLLAKFFLFLIFRKFISALYKYHTLLLINFYFKYSLFFSVQVSFLETFVYSLKAPTRFVMSVRAHQLQLDGFLWNLVLGNFIAISRGTRSLVTFITYSVSRQVHSFFHSDFSTQGDLQLPLLISSILSFL